MWFEAFVSVESLLKFFVPDLILRILKDAKEFDTRIWIAAVAIGE